MTEPRSVALVFHAHTPYVRQAGPSAAGEEPLHMLAIESYIPLLAGLYDVVEHSGRLRIGLALSPILLEQLADRVVQKHLYQALTERVEAAQAAIRACASDAHGEYLAQFELQLVQRALRVFDRQWGRDLVGATRTLVDAGVIEPLVHTATCVVPQHHDLSALRTQFQIGQLALSRHLGRRASVVWAVEEPLPRALLRLLPDMGIHGVITQAARQQPAAVWLDEPLRIWGLVPDAALALHIRSATWGYPGDAVYRDPAQPGLARSGARYDPFHAYARARLHARHFIALLKSHPAHQPQVLALPMEVLGSGWAEGGMWLRTVLEELQRTPEISLITPSTAAQAPATGGYTTLSESMLIDGSMHSATQRLRAAVGPTRRDGLHERILNQAARELLLAQSGDWDRLYASKYAQARRTMHLAHVNDLLRLASFEQLAPAQEELLATLEEQHNPFPFLHFGLFMP